MSCFRDYRSKESVNVSCNSPMSVCLGESVGEFTGNTSRKPSVEPPVFKVLSQMLLNYLMNKRICSAFVLKNTCHFFHLVESLQM